MMRTGGSLNTREWARLFQEYFSDFLAANDAFKGKVSILRALPHEGAVAEDDFVEVLDYGKGLPDCRKCQPFFPGPLFLPP